MNEKEFRSANNVIDLEDCPSITCVFDKQSQTWHTVPNRKINWGKRGCLFIIIQVDSREQKFKHVTNYFDKHGIKWVRSKCIVGDYVNLENPMIVIDRKKDLQEVAGNVCQQHARFVRELELAKDLGYKMIILIEEVNIRELHEVNRWYNWRRKHNPKAITGKTLRKIMETMSEKYGVIWLFTTPQECGKRIVELLKERKR